MWDELYASLAPLRELARSPASLAPLRELARSPAITVELEEPARRVLASLTPREERVLRERFGIADTLEEVSEDFEETRRRIREIEARALAKLRSPRRAEALRRFLAPVSVGAQMGLELRRPRAFYERPWLPKGLAVVARQEGARICAWVRERDRPFVHVAGKRVRALALDLEGLLVIVRRRWTRAQLESGEGPGEDARAVVARARRALEL